MKLISLQNVNYHANFVNNLICGPFFGCTTIVVPKINVSNNYYS